MKWIIRHSERIDINKKKWESHKRFKENEYDVPITEKGKKIARSAANEIYDNDDDIENITYIYSSPFTRCIETALEIQTQLEKKIKRLVPIRVEYGIVESNYHRYIKLLHNFRKFKNGNVIVDFKKKDIIYTDNKLKVENLILKHKNKLDKSYKSFTKFSQIKYLDTDINEGWSKRMNAFKHIWNLEGKNTYIIVSHGLAIKDGICAILNKFNIKELDVFGWETWCILTGFKNNKMVYKPSIDYYK